MKIPILLLTANIVVVTSACGVRTIRPESDATFAMHQESRVFVVDRPLSGAPATVTAAAWIRAPGGPAWALRRDGKTLAAYWIEGNASATARAGSRSSDPLLGDVRPSWDQNAIRLRIDPPDGPPLQSDVFARAADGGGPAAISRSAQTILDVRGRYQAALRDAAGAEVGWLRLRIGPYEQAARVFEAALPAGISEGLAVAAVLALASEIDWIESHTLNVYQSDRGPLIQSFPVH